jgi:hypothetical protein
MQSNKAEFIYGLLYCFAETGKFMSLIFHDSYEWFSLQPNPFYLRHSTGVCGNGLRGKRLLKLIRVQGAM